MLDYHAGSCLPFVCEMNLSNVGYMLDVCI